MKGKAMLKQTLIAAALGLAMSSGAAFAAPIGLQGLQSHAVIGERGATVEPVHYRQRRYGYAYPRYRYGYAYPRYRYGYAYPRYRYGYAYPRYRYGYVYPQYGYGYTYRYGTRPRVSFGLSYGW
jgi:hypothetical protein